MKASYIAIFLILNISFSFCSTTQQNVEQGKQLFSKLRNSSDIGRNLYDTIALELSTSDAKEDQTVVSRIIEMLQEVRANLVAQQTEYQEEVDQKFGACDAQIDELRESIESVEDRIDDLEDKVPVRRDDLELKQQEQEAAQQELEFYQAEQGRTLERAAQRKQEYEEQRNETQQVIAALAQARGMIAQLSKASDFAQVSSHFKGSLKLIQQQHNQKMIKFLAQMTAVADQDAVNSLLEILDDLIAAAEETASMYARAEGARQDRLASDLQQLETNINNATRALNEAQADASSAQLRLNEVQSDLQAQRESLDIKKELLADQEQACEDAVANVQQRLTSFTDIIAIIDQVITLMQYSSISGVKDMMSDYDDSYQGEEETDYLGEYSTDKGELHSKENYVEQAGQIGQDNGEFVQKKSFLGYA